MSLPRIITTALVISVALAPSAGARATGRQPCGHANDRLTTVGAPPLERSVQCAVNAQRRRHRLPALRRNARLDRAAESQARAMVAKHFFDHRSPSGSTPVRRVRAAGYLRGRVGAWIVAENLGWGSLGKSTPQAIVTAWMHSAPHRANILLRGIRDIGVAAVQGRPTPGARDPEATVYVIVLGLRGRLAS